MKKLIFLVIFLSINSFAFSNDSMIVIGKTVEIVDNEETNIAMLDEVINISLYRGYYEVDVVFDFYNDGPEETILLGFPVQASIFDNPEDREWAKADDFKSYINGELITEYIIRVEETKDYYLSITTWFIREVTFPENSHTYSRVTYKMPYSMSGFYSEAGYIYGTGRCWKGSIGKMTFIVNHGDNNIIHGIHIYDNQLVLFDYICEANGSHKYTRENVNPEGNERITIRRKYYDLYGEYKGQFGESWDGIWLWDKILITDNKNDNRHFTKNQLRLFINFFYALHGYEFKNSFYQNYFNNLQSSGYLRDMGYKINPNFSESDFNEFERENIAYLLSLERLIPYDERMQTEALYLLPGETVSNQQPVKDASNEQYNDVYEDDVFKEETFDKDLSVSDKENKMKSQFILIYAVIAVLILTAGMIVLLKRKK